jgi:class 3 adenylate cyclase
MSEPAVPAEPAPSERVRAGREALERHAWQDAFDLLSQADREGPLSGADLEALATAAFFTAHPDLEHDAKERAFKTHSAEGRTLRAAYVALDIARSYLYEGKASIGSAWLRRAERLLEGEDESYAHGYLALVRSEGARTAGDADEALRLAEEAVRIGERASDADLKAWGLTFLGSLKIATGATSEGFALMEEASIAGVNGELSPFTTGVTCCAMIAACRDLTDYRRATEWTEATERWCERQSVSGFPGVCRVHRAEVVAIGGDWERAEQELVRATDELEAYHATPPQADGYYAIGEIRRLKGDLAGAEEALRQAHARGRTPQPALSLIRLAEGKVAAALKSIDAAIRDETWDQWARARLLPAKVEISIAANDVALARAAADEFARISATFESPALVAQRRGAIGRVLLAEGDAAGAASELRAAVRLWREVANPYEVARARALLSKALRALGDEEDADLELRAALDEFVRLGAALDARAATREQRLVEERRSGPAHVRRTFMFTDIVGSTNLAEALGDEAWERLLRWHDDTLRGLFAASGGEVVNSTGDGFFVAFESARAGIDCAIAIQRALAEQGRTSGFSLSVRVGLHTAEANRRGDDYSGVGVHLAARVAGLANAGEIVATGETVADAGEVVTSSLRDVTVRGVSASVAVATIAWQ